MKKIAALILASSMIFSLAACSESQPGTDISVVTQIVDSKKDPDSSGSDKLTPPTTFGEDFAKHSYSDFEYTGKSTKNDTAKKQMLYYDGSIREENIKQQVFDYICRTVNSKEILLKDEQAVQGGATALITLTDQSGNAYSLCEGILVDSPMLQGGQAIYIFKTPDKKYSYFSKDHNESKNFENLLADGLQIEENLTKTQNYGNKDKVKTPVLSQGDFKGSKSTDYEYSGRTVQINTALKKKYYYEGKLTDPNSCKNVFELLYKYNIEDAVKLGKNQALLDISEPIITLTYKNSRQIRLCESRLVQSKNESDAVRVLVLSINTGETYCYYYNQQIVHLITQQLDNNIRTKENLVKTESFGTVSSENIAFMFVYSNYAWVPTVNGTYITKNGEVRSFDFSTSSGALSGNYNEGMLAMICEDYARSKPTAATVDTAKIKKALDYAAKVDPDAKVTEEHKMCDYGQRTLYAVVDGKLVMLYSKGDNDKTVEDVNAAKAINVYDEMMQTDDED